MRVNRVILRNVSEACDGLPFALTLFSAAGTSTETTGPAMDVRNIRDRQPGPGVDRAGIVRVRIRVPAENVDGIALVIGGTATP